MTITKERVLASFYTVNKAPIKHLRVYFSPKQAGTGDPSPENVREISGYTGITIEQCGKNICNYPNGGGEYIFFPIPPGTQVTASSSLGGVFTLKNSSDESFIRYTQVKNNGIRKYEITFIAPENKDLYRFNRQSGAQSCQLEIGSTATAYESYHGNTYTLDWSNDIGTIYGGYVDLVTGELVQTHMYLNMANYLQNKNIEMVNGTLCRIRSDYNVTAPNVCSHFIEQSFKNWSMMTDTTSNTCWWGGGYIGFASSTLGFTTAEQWKTWLMENNVSITAELNTPITHQLTPTQLQTLLGRNNIWSNADRVEVEYDLAESNDELYRRRNILLRTPHLVTPAPAPGQSFNTDMVAPLKECKIHFSPVQEGTGDPSPSNIRSISGWAGLTMFNNKLPDAYQLVEYVETTGNQYVDTGIKPYTGIGFKCKFLTKSTFTSGGNYGCIFGGRKSSQNCDFQLTTYSSSSNFVGTLRVGVTNSQGYDAGLLPANVVQTVSLINNIYTNANGVQTTVAATDWDTIADSNKYSVYMFTLHSGNTSIQGGLGCRIYYLEFYKNSDLYRRYVPCYRKSDDMPGMYEIFTDTFCPISNATGVVVGSNLTGISSLVDWSTSNGTVYGGYVDLVAGKLVETHKILTLNGNESKWRTLGTNGSDKRFDLIITDLGVSTMPISNIFTYKGGQQVFGYYNLYYTQSLVITDKDGLFETLEDFKSWLAENTPSFIYTLATPIEYQLTPTQLKSLIGTNNIWSNANGLIDIKYWTH